MALTLLIDANDYTSELVHESLTINQTNDSLNSTCSFIIRDAGVIEKNAWTVGVTRVEDGDVISGHTTFPKTKVEVSVVDGATVYFAGILSRINILPAGCIDIGEYIEPDTQMLKCYCHDFNQILEESMIDTLEEYTMTSDKLIIDDLFPKYVTGIDFATNVVAVQTYKEISFENISVRQALAQLVARSGAVCYVDYAKKLWHKAVGADSPAWHLSDVPDQVSSFSYLDPVQREEDAINLVNRIFVIGSTGGTWFIDAPSIADYGTHSAIVKDTRLLSSAEVTLRGLEILEKFKDPITTYGIKTYKDGLRAGMYIRFVCAYLDVDATFLINQLQVTFPVDGEPLYELKLGGLTSSIGGAARRSDVDHIYSEPPVTSSQLPLASRGWGHDMTFSATDDDTVAWTAGTITTASGQTFSINAGNSDDPGAMAAKTIVYLDTVISLTDLQMTTVETAAIGNNRIMVAVCWPSGVAGVDAGFQVFGATGELATYLNATNVIANCITANEVAANTITAAEMNVAQLSAINVNMGALTAGTITMHTAGQGTLIFSSGGIGLFDNADVLQIHLRTVDGDLEAGNGNVILNADGVTLSSANLDAARVKWGTGFAHISAYSILTSNYLLLTVPATGETDENTVIQLAAEGQGAHDDAQLEVVSEDDDTDARISSIIGGSELFKVLAVGVRVGAGIPFRVGTGVADPVASIADGMLFYRTDTDKLRLRANGAWVNLN